MITPKEQMSDPNDHILKGCFSREPIDTKQEIRWRLPAHREVTNSVHFISRKDNYFSKVDETPEKEGVGRCSPGTFLPGKRDNHHSGVGEKKEMTGKERVFKNRCSIN